MAEETGQNEPGGGLGEAEGASDRFSFINENTSELEQQGLLRIKDELREPGEPSPEATEGLAPSTVQESETVQITLTVGEESSQIETTDGQEPSTVLESKTLEITLTVNDEESSDSEEAVIDLTEDDKLKEECLTKKPVVLLESVKLDSSGSLKHFVNKKKKTHTDSDYEGECPNSPSSTSSYTSVEGEEPKGKRVKRQLYSPVQWDDGPRKARASAVKARASIAKLNEEDNFKEDRRRKRPPPEDPEVIPIGVKRVNSGNYQSCFPVKNWKKSLMTMNYDLQAESASVKRIRRRMVLRPPPSEDIGDRRYSSHIKCKFCNEHQKTLEQLYHHFSRMHPMRFLYECQECGQQFKTAALLEKHTQTHSLRFAEVVYVIPRKVIDAKVLYHCPVLNCNSQPLSWSMIINHLHFHKPEDCLLCGERISPNPMKTYCTHVSIHIEGGPYLCPYCPSMAHTDLLQFRRHLEVVHNADNKPWVCRFCHKTYKTFPELDLHLLGWHSNKPYCCQYCGQDFSSIVTMEGHMQKHERGATHDQMFEKYKPACVSVFKSTAATTGPSTVKKQLEHLQQIQVIRKDGSVRMINNSDELPKEIKLTPSSPRSILPRILKRPASVVPTQAVTQAVSQSVPKTLLSPGLQLPPGTYHKVFLMKPVQQAASMGMLQVVPLMVSQNGMLPNQNQMFTIPNVLNQNVQSTTNQLTVASQVASQGISVLSNPATVTTSQVTSQGMHVLSNPATVTTSQVTSQGMRVLSNPATVTTRQVPSQGVRVLSNPATVTTSQTVDNTMSLKITDVRGSSVVQEAPYTVIKTKTDEQDSDNDEEEDDSKTSPIVIEPIQDKGKESSKSSKKSSKSDGSQLKVCSYEHCLHVSSSAIDLWVNHYMPKHFKQGSNSEFMCSMCAGLFGSWNWPPMHHSCKKPQWIHVCAECGLLFQNMREKMQHYTSCKHFMSKAAIMKAGMPVDLLSCQYCLAPSPNITVLCLHMMRDHKSLRFNSNVICCEQCPEIRRFLDVKHLWEHNKVIHRAWWEKCGKWLCQSCGVDHTTEQEFKEHSIYCHAAYADAYHLCLDCCDVFETEAEVAEHRFKTSCKKKTKVKESGNVKGFRKTSDAVLKDVKLNAAENTYTKAVEPIAGTSADAKPMIIQPEDLYSADSNPLVISPEDDHDSDSDQEVFVRVIEPEPCDPPSSDVGFTDTDIPELPWYLKDICDSESQSCDTESSMSQSILKPDNKAEPTSFMPIFPVGSEGDPAPTPITITPDDAGNNGPEENSPFSLTLSDLRGSVEGFEPISSKLLASTEVKDLTSWPSETKESLVKSAAPDQQNLTGNSSVTTTTDQPIIENPTSDTSKDDQRIQENVTTAANLFWQDIAVTSSASQSIQAGPETLMSTMDQSTTVSAVDKSSQESESLISSVTASPRSMTGNEQLTQHGSAVVTPIMDQQVQKGVRGVTSETDQEIANLFGNLSGSENHALQTNSQEDRKPVVKQEEDTPLSCLTCKHCQLECDDFEAIRDHVRLTHKPVPKVLTCPCLTQPPPSAMKWPHKYWQHVISNHQQWMSSHKMACTVCGEFFKAEKSFQYHQIYQHNHDVKSIKVDECIEIVKRLARAKKASSGLPETEESQDEPPKPPGPENSITISSSDEDEPEPQTPTVSISATGMLQQTQGTFALHQPSTPISIEPQTMYASTSAPELVIAPSSTSASATTHVCTECGKHLPDLFALKKHQRIVHPAGLIKCEKCKQRIQVDKMKDHVCPEENDVTALFPCDFCPQMFDTLMLKNRHIASAHRNQLKRCKVCGKAFVNQDTLNKHIIRMHPDMRVGKKPTSKVPSSTITKNLMTIKKTPAKIISGKLLSQMPGTSVTEKMVVYSKPKTSSAVMNCMHQMYAKKCRFCGKLTVDWSENGKHELVCDQNPSVESTKSAKKDSQYLGEKRSLRALLSEKKSMLKVSAPLIAGTLSEDELQEEEPYAGKQGGTQVINIVTKGASSISDNDAENSGGGESELHDEESTHSGGRIIALRNNSMSSDEEKDGDVIYVTPDSPDRALDDLASKENVTSSKSKSKHSPENEALLDEVFGPSSEAKRKALEEEIFGPDEKAKQKALEEEVLFGSSAKGRHQTLEDEVFGPSHKEKSKPPEKDIFGSPDKTNPDATQKSYVPSQAAKLKALEEELFGPSNALIRRVLAEENKESAPLQESKGPSNKSLVDEVFGPQKPIAQKQSTLMKADQVFGPETSKATSVGESGFGQTKSVTVISLDEIFGQAEVASFGSDESTKSANSPLQDEEFEPTTQSNSVSSQQVFGAAEPSKDTLVEEECGSTKPAYGITIQDVTGSTSNSALSQEKSQPTKILINPFEGLTSETVFSDKREVDERLEGSKAAESALVNEVSQPASAANVSNWSLITDTNSQTSIASAIRIHKDTNGQGDMLTAIATDTYINHDDQVSENGDTTNEIYSCNFCDRSFTLECDLEIHKLNFQHF